MERSPHVPTASHLPPQDVWLHNPFTEGKIETPVTERGVVDAERLIQLGLSSIDPSYNWLEPFEATHRRPFNDIHHLQWPKRHYGDPDGDPTGRQFRNLHINLLNTPRIFHNWLHLLTEPSAVPSHETMTHYIEAQRVVVTLFRDIQIGKRTLRLPFLTDSEIEQRLEKRFDSFLTTVETGLSLPPEYQLVDLSRCTGTSPEEMFEPRLVREIGRKAIIPSVVRRVTQASAASCAVLH